MDLPSMILRGKLKQKKKWVVFCRRVNGGINKEKLGNALTNHHKTTIAQHDQGEFNQ